MLIVNRRALEIQNNFSWSFVLINTSFITTFAKFFFFTRDDGAIISFDIIYKCVTALYKQYQYFQRGLLSRHHYYNRRYIPEHLCNAIAEDQILLLPISPNKEKTVNKYRYLKQNVSPFAAVQFLKLQSLCYNR